ncbi:MAG: CDP-alcohol phosphatidyltransferase family protein [Patescibacteria group bacterium]
MNKLKKIKFDSSLMHKNHYPFFERVFYRPIAGLITPILARWGIRPILINVFSFVLGLLGICLITIGDYKIRVSGTLILIASYIFDCVDGQLARGLRKTNKFGALIDTTLDSIKESLIFLGLAFQNQFVSSENSLALYLAIIIILGQRMLGRTIPWYRLIYNKGVEEIKTEILKGKSGLFRLVSIFFSESYRSGTIWMVIFLGIVTNQIILIFSYFIVVIYSLWLVLLISGFQRGQKYID